MLKILIGIVLFPITFIYGIIITFRNFLFDIKILKSTSFNVPVVSVGNITVGGTGKSPHVESLIELLSDKNIAVLSRGYKRKTKGFIKADENSTAETIGDEPKQIKQKFPYVNVFVCEKRVEGINQIITNSNPDLIILDDAYQHRYVKPTLNILLIDYNRPVHKDFLLPSGRLREFVSAKKRADVIIISKCPTDLNERGKDLFLQKIKPENNQKIFFSTISYGDLKPVFPDDIIQFPSKENINVLAFAGIAKPELFFDHLKKSNSVLSMVFTDHHYYNNNDFEKILKKYKTLRSPNKVLITTEKDAVRITETKNINKSIKENLFYLPIKSKILFNRNSEFEKTIKSYVE